MLNPPTGGKVNEMKQKLIIKPIAEAIKATPYGSTEGQKGEAKVIARIFGGHLTAYILEGYHCKGEEWDGNTVYGLVNIGDGFEYGPFNLKDFEKGYICRSPWGDIRMPFERDISVEPLKRTLAEVAYENNENMPYVNWN